MNLNQITIPSLDLTKSIPFYEKLGLKLIVKSIPSCTVDSKRASDWNVERLRWSETRHGNPDHRLSDWLVGMDLCDVYEFKSLVPPIG